MESADLGYVAGKLDVASAQYGIMGASQETAVTFFRLVAGIQSHPVRAMDRLAYEVYSYCRAAESLQEPLIDVAVKYTLVSGFESSLIMANSIHWFASPELRHQAKIKLGEMAEAGRKGIRWPWKQVITLPAYFQPAINDSRLEHEKR